MKITVKKTTVEEIDVTFPVYKSFLGRSFIKVINQNLTIRVSDTSIDKFTISDVFLTSEDYEESNEDEFLTAFNSTILELKTLV